MSALIGKHPGPKRPGDESFVPMSNRRRMLRSLARNPSAVTGAVIVVLMLLVAFLAPYLAPYNPNQMDIANRLKAPSAAHLLGSDDFGRDILSRMIYGTQLSLTVGVAVVLLATLAGTVLGLLAGYFRRLDNLLMRVMDGLMAFPAILLAIAIMAALGPKEMNVIIAIAAVYTPRMARIVRGSALSVKRMEYVEAAAALGAGHGRIMFRHILPNCMSPIIVQATFIFAYAVLAEASLSFLGVGTPPPAPSWGNILADGRLYIRLAPWITVFPGTAIMATVLGLNLLGDGLRDVLDPRMRV